ncbi:MAG: hypothetical protein Q8T03_08890 [Bacteroidota bacterium]|nr:hypothetical protein [Bacteroidota bacterium]
MENNKDLDEFLSNKMSLNELDLRVPILSEEARRKIIARKKPANEREDFFFLVAAFLNFKIKLYHAVIATIVIAGFILFLTREDKGNKNEAHSSEYVSNIASVRSSTVLSSICTFGLNKKQIYDNGTN